jgi:hypothetical protein
MKKVDVQQFLNDIIRSEEAKEKTAGLRGSVLRVAFKTESQVYDLFVTVIGIIRTYEGEECTGLVLNVEGGKGAAISDDPTLEHVIYKGGQFEAIFMRFDEHFPREVPCKGPLVELFNP